MGRRGVKQIFRPPKNPRRRRGEIKARNEAESSGGARGLSGEARGLSTRRAAYRRGARLIRGGARFIDKARRLSAGRAVYRQGARFIDGARGLSTGRAAYPASGQLLRRNERLLRRAQFHTVEDAIFLPCTSTRRQNTCRQSTRRQSTCRQSTCRQIRDSSALPQARPPAAPQRNAAKAEKLPAFFYLRARRLKFFLQI